MRKILVIGLFALASVSWAQSGPGFGIKGGLNYNGNGDFFDSAQAVSENPDRNAGFHLGIWGKIGNRLYVRPELVYSRTQSSYDEGDLKLQKLDLPVLVGLKIFGPLHGFVGPSFQYILESQFADNSFSSIEEDFTVGANLGLGLNLGKLGVDLRYERGFTNNELDLINANITTLTGDRVDTRPEQLILSLSLKL